MASPITGKIHFLDADCTFYFDDNTLTLLPCQTRLCDEHMRTDTVLENLYGETSDGRIICFLKVYPKEIGYYRFIGVVQYYIIGLNNNAHREIEPFNAITFSGDVIDRFFPPLATFNDDQSSFDYETGANTIVLKPFCETQYFEELLTDLRIELCVSRPTQPSNETFSLGELHSYLRVTTTQEWCLTDIISMHDIFHRFFVLFNFRWGINFEEITISKMFEENKYYTVGSFYFHTSTEKNDIKARNTICYNDVKDRMQKLFLMDNFLEQYLLFIPETDRDADMLNFARYIQTCSVFEGLFDKIYYDVLPRSTEEHHLSINKQYLDFAHELVNRTSGREKKLANHYLKMIETADEKSLEAQFAYVLKENVSILKSVFPNTEFSEGYIADVSHTFAYQRNHLDHGQLEILNKLEVSSYSIAVCLIYIMILKSIEVEDKKIVNSLRKLFRDYKV